MCKRYFAGRFVLFTAILSLAAAGCARHDAAGPRAEAAPPAKGGTIELAAADEGQDAKQPAAPAIPRAAAYVAAEIPLAALPTDRKRSNDFNRLPPPDPGKFPHLVPLSPDFDVWVDPVERRVVLRAGVCLREGPLELFACIHQWVDNQYAPSGKTRRGTKEYESVVTVNTTGALVHAALLAVGAIPGGPAQFDPEYEPARGTVIDVMLYWIDADGISHEARAQDWVRDVRTGETMEHEWVFAGSLFLVNAQTGQRHYLGEEGNLICVSNFPDAVLDVPVPSTALNEALLFETFTERIPPVGTPVTMVLQPRLDEAEPPVQRVAERDNEGQ